MENVSFHESIENIDASNNFSYLLNFWHLSKLNKEFEFIKRNGMHPALLSTSVGNANDMITSEGNSIQTAFYTSFRIFIKSVFPGAEAFKTRDVEEWKVAFKTGESHLDNLSFLIYKFNENKLNNDGIIRVASRRYGVRNIDSFTVKLSDKDQLHSKILIDKINEMQEEAKINVDQKIVTELNDITKKIAKLLDIKEHSNEKVSKVKKTIASDVFESIQPIITPRQTVNPNLALRELLPVYNQLKDSINMFTNRIKFSYILNFAKQGSTNVVINNIEDNEDNYQSFMAITNQMAA
jgi:hypothetical protein